MDSQLSDPKSVFSLWKNFMTSAGEEIQFPKLDRCLPRKYFLTKLSGGVMWRKKNKQ